MKKFDLKKEELRGSIKQLMTVRGLRMINLSNYNAWAGNVDKKLVNIHSIKIDIMTGFVNLFFTAARTVNAFDTVGGSRGWKGNGQPRDLR